MPTSVIIAWVITLLLQIVFPVVLAIWFRKRYGVGWPVFFYGALIFFLFQMITRVPAILIIGQALAPTLQGSQVLLVLYFVGLAFTAGLFESVGRWVGYHWLFPRRRLPYDWRHGVAYGIGHGGIESILLVGLNSLSSLLTAMQITAFSEAELRAQYPATLIDQVLAARTQFLNMRWYEPLLGGIERVFTLAFHIALSLIVLRVFTRHQVRWLWVAVGVHALVDFVAPAWTQLLRQPAWTAEIGLALVAAVSLWFILREKRRSESESAAEPALP